MFLTGSTGGMVCTYKSSLMLELPHVCCLYTMGVVGRLDHLQLIPVGGPFERVRMNIPEILTTYIAWQSVHCGVG